MKWIDGCIFSAVVLLAAVSFGEFAPTPVKPQVTCVWGLVIAADSVATTLTIELREAMSFPPEAAFTRPFPPQPYLLLCREEK